MRVQLACLVAATVACDPKTVPHTQQASQSTATAAAAAVGVSDARFGAVFPSMAPPFIADGPITFRPGFARRTYRIDRARVEITVASAGKEPGAYARWLADSAEYSQAPIPQDEANGFFTCAGHDPEAGCDLHVQTRSGFHIEVMGDGHVRRADLLMLLSHLRLSELPKPFQSF